MCQFVLTLGFILNNSNLSKNQPSFVVSSFASSFILFIHISIIGVGQGSIILFVHISINFSSRLLISIIGVDYSLSVLVQVIFVPSSIISLNLTFSGRVDLTVGFQIYIFIGFVSIMVPFISYMKLELSEKGCWRNHV